jgi:hypothetical protein
LVLVVTAVFWERDIPVRYEVREIMGMQFPEVPKGPTVPLAGLRLAMNTKEIPYL